MINTKKRIESPPPIPAPSSNYMVSPETRRQHTKQQEKSRSLNILVSEPSKQSHVNVFRKKKEICQKENKIVELQKRLKVQNITEQVDSSRFMKNIVQEHEICEAQETTTSDLESIDEEPTVKDVSIDNRNLKRQTNKKLLVKKNISSTASFSPLKSSSRNNINANNTKESDSHRYVFEISEKNHSPSKSPESERYYDYTSSPAEMEGKNSNVSSVSQDSSQLLQSTTDKPSESK